MTEKTQSTMFRKNTNEILLALPQRESLLLCSKLEHVELPIGTVLNEAAQRIDSVFFLNGGLASFLASMTDNKCVETGVVGRDGIIGVPLASGLHTSPTRSVIRIGCDGFRVKASDFVAVLPDCPVLMRLIQRFGQELTLQASFNAACNRLHDVSERLSKWLLVYQDRLGENVLPLTHYFLAEMLGTRRASVSVAANILQTAGLITYERGKIEIKGRTKLERASCECYRLLNQQIKAWKSEQ
jgi:CRP-like cAMP-binding protein